jgi:regulatory protein
VGRITAIEIQKNDPDRRSIYIDGDFSVGVSSEVVLTLGLYVGQEVGEQELEAVAYREDRRKAINSAINLLSYRDRTIGEIEKRLKSKSYPEDLIGEVIEELTRLELVDDKKFSKDWVESRGKFKPKSRSALVAELRNKGVDKELAERAVENIDDEGELKMAKSVAENAARKTSKEGDALVRYLSGVLARRGFNWEIIRRVLEELLPNS